MDKSLDHVVPTIRACRTTCTTCSAASSTTATFLEIQPAGRRTSSSGSRGSAVAASAIVAQQPAVLAGALDIDASVKAARSSGRATASTSRS
jgi:hypothetical protein